MPLALIAAITLWSRAGSADPQRAPDPAAEVEQDVHETGAEDARAREARQLFLQGVVQYRLGNFEQARQLFQGSLSLISRPSAILNLAQTYRQLGEHRKALFHFKLYVTEWERENPGEPSPYRQEVDRRIRQMEQAIVTAERRAEQERERARRDEERRERARLLLATRQQPPAAGPRPFYERWWFWTAVGVVVAGVTTATVVALRPDDIPPVQGTLAQVELPVTRPLR